jgi:hypothetical protein
MQVRHARTDGCGSRMSRSPCESARLQSIRPRWLGIFHGRLGRGKRCNRYQAKRRIERQYIEQQHPAMMKERNAASFRAITNIVAAGQESVGRSYVTRNLVARALKRT